MLVINILFVVLLAVNLWFGIKAFVILNVNFWNEFYGKDYVNRKMRFDEKYPKELIDQILTEEEKKTIFRP